MNTSPESSFEEFRKSSSPEALGRVFDELAPRLLALAGHLAGRSATPEDLVQATFVEAIEHRDRWDSERPLLPWLVGILIRLYRTECRRGARVLEPDRLVERTTEDPLERVESNELVAAISDTLESLPKSYRTVLVLRLVHGLTPPQISGALDRPLETVRTQLRRGRQLLRDGLPTGVAPTVLAALSTLLGGSPDGNSLAAVRSEVLKTASSAVPTATVATSTSIFGSVAKTLGSKSFIFTASTVIAGVGLWFTVGPGDRSEHSIAIDEIEGAAPAERIAEAEPELTEHRRLVGDLPAVTDNVPEAPAITPVDAGPETEIAGTVMNAEGAEVASVQVNLLARALDEFYVQNPDELFNFDVVSSQLTDAKGNFAFKVLPDQPYHIEVRAEGFARRLHGHAFGGERLDLALEQGSRISLEVLNIEAGTPVADARVRAWHEGDIDRAIDGFTDASGMFAADDVPRGVYNLLVNAPALSAPAPRQVKLTPSEPTHVVFELEPGTLVTGRVTDEQSGAPIAGAEISDSENFIRSVRSGPDGRYELVGFNPARYYAVHIRAAGFGASEREFPENAVGKGALTVDFGLLPARAADGRIVDTDGSPLAGVVVSAVGEEDVVEWEVTRTDADGRFEFTSLSSDLPHRLLLRKPGYGTRVVDFPAEEAQLEHVAFGELALPSPARVSGIVRSRDGEPLAGYDMGLTGIDRSRGELRERLASAGVESGAAASVEESESDEDLQFAFVAMRKSRSDSLGRFHFADLAPGKYTLEVTRPDQYEDPVATLVVEVEAGENLHELELVIEPGSKLTGRVVDSDGEECDGAYVATYITGGTDSPRDAAGVETGANGVFNLVPGELAPGESLWILADNSSLSTSAGTFVSRVSPPIQILPTDSNVDLKIPRHVVLRGRVLDARGEPVGRAMVDVDFADTLIHVGGLVTQADGTFAIDVPEGLEYEVEVWENQKDDGEPLARVARFAPEDGELELRLR